MNLLDISTCAEHGWFAHVGIHEAGHAVAAVVLEFDFVDVSINSGQDTLARMSPRLKVEAGGLRLTTDQPSDWVGPRPDEALALLLAGSLAENELLGHCIAEGYSRDFEIWRWGTGRNGTNDPAEVAPLIKTGSSAARRLVADHRKAVLSVYRLFVDKAPTNEQGVLPFDDPLVLTREEVRAAVLSTT